MPGLDEADRCPHCNAILRDPPACCAAAIQDHSDQMHRQNDPHYIRDEDLYPEEDEPDYCWACGAVINDLDDGPLCGDCDEPERNPHA